MICWIQTDPGADGAIWQDSLFSNDTFLVFYRRRSKSVEEYVSSIEKEVMRRLSCQINR